MTATDPRRLDMAMDDTLRNWTALTGQSVPLALRCAHANPLIPELLCEHLDGHAGEHGSGPGICWADPTDTEKD